MSFYRQELPYRTDSAAYYAAICDLPFAAWLDSCGMDRFDILTAAPHRVLNLACLDSFASIRDELGAPVPPLPGIPFAGGALGYWAYDGEAVLGIYDWALLIDHRQKTAHLVSHLRYAETKALLEQLLQRFGSDVASPVGEFTAGVVACNFTRESYSEAFARVQAYLQAGDCYQVNLAQRFSAKFYGDAQGAYLKLRKLSPAPFSAFLNFADVQVLCASPERFILVQDGRVETRPIKGTRPRDADPVLDRKLAEELASHPKDRAENLMIVDLLRNDLGKSCVAGSVRVPKLFEVESYARVHHLVSTVQGRLSAGVDALAALEGCFPGGSITGAPKLRAMQIIEELEPDARGIYCGAIGYAGFDGNMDTNIVIRTLVCRDGEINCWAGGGLVSDSVCDAEYQETFDKASAMLELLRQCGDSD